MHARLLRTLIVGLCAGIGLAACGDPAADLVLINGKIVTVDDARPEVEALAVVDGRIAAVGTAEEIRPWIGADTEVLDLQGRLAIPGFIEGHGHFMGLGNSKMILDLTEARTWDEIVAMVEAAVARAEPGEWILGRGWHQEKWEAVPEGAVEGVPTHHRLSAVSPDNPVLLGHASGHAAFANARAMELGRISPETEDPEGGEIVRDAAGRPTGLLREKAQGLVRMALSEARKQMTPDELEAEQREQVRLAGAEALAHGITTFHDAGASFETIDLFRRLADEGALPVRLYVMVRYASPEELEARLPRYRLIGYGNDFLTVRSIKRQVDGALGPHGAWLLEPYRDLPSSTGLVLEPLDEIRRAAEIALRHGFQVNTHAIGDRGNREILNLYEQIFTAHPDSTDLRWRIEHAQHLHPDDIPRFARLGVIASMQGVHCTSDGPWVLKRLGPERAESGAYMWRALWDSGAVVTNGTDVPVEDIDPIASFYATVTRRMPDGEVFYGRQALTRMEALRSYTLNNAYAAFEEDRKGSLTPGKLADIVVLSRDILTVPEEEILEAEVVYTILGGDVVYRAPAEPAR
ncbi:amidohydrolase [Rhodothermaceae bacterium RA]|nr:amidohydrolase [Rhodothermaceae bacterium RA]